MVINYDVANKYKRANILLIGAAMETVEISYIQYNLFNINRCNHLNKIDSKITLALASFLPQIILLNII